MLFLHFNNKEIDSYVTNLNNQKRIYLPNNFLDIDSDLEKLNDLKTELCAVLDDHRLNDMDSFQNTFIELQAGAYKLVNSDDELVYEGVFFDNDYIPAHLRPDAHNFNPETPPTLVDNSLAGLLHRRLELQKELALVNTQIVGSFRDNLDSFDLTIEKLESVRDTWKDRLQNLLDGTVEIEEDTIDVFNDVLGLIKTLGDRLAKYL